jgi:uncharacterized protein (TIGR02246 family)
MKTINFICTALFITGLFLNVTAQNATDVAAVKKFYYDGWQTYLTMDFNKIMTLYTDKVVSIDPAGGITTDKKTMRETWEGFFKMLDTKPTFTYQEPNIRFITPDVAVVSFKYADDIKMQGQQIGGEKSGLMIVQKVNGAWKLTVDASVPVLSMPDFTAQTNLVEQAINTVYEKAMTALNTRDAAAMAALFTEDADLVDPSGTIVHGRAAIQQHHVALFNFWSKLPKPDRFSREISDKKLRSIAPDKVLYTYRQIETSVFGGKNRVDEMTHSVLLINQNGQWLIESLTLTPKTESPIAVAAKH